MIKYSRRRLLVVSLGSGAIGVLLGLATASADNVDSSKVERARVLAIAVAPPSVPPITSSTARVAADGLAPSVPLPDGGNFNGVRWELAEGMVSPSEVSAVLEYNAACQWLRALRDGREAAVAEDVLTEVPNWPTLRGTTAGDILRDAVEELRQGDGATIAGVMSDCDSSSAREIDYAVSLGLEPSS